MQNTAARLLAGTGILEHITPVIQSMHWLPVHVKIDFKVLLLICKAVNGIAPSYVSDMLKSYVPGKSLWLFQNRRKRQMGGGLFLSMHHISGIICLLIYSKHRLLMF